MNIASTDKSECLKWKKEKRSWTQPARDDFSNPNGLEGERGSILSHLYEKNMRILVFCDNKSVVTIASVSVPELTLNKKHLGIAGICYHAVCEAVAAQIEAFANSFAMKGTRAPFFGRPRSKMRVHPSSLCRFAPPTNLHANMSYQRKGKFSWLSYKVSCWWQQSNGHTLNRFCTSEL